VGRWLQVLAFVKDTWSPRLEGAAGAQGDDENDDDEEEEADVIPRWAVQDVRTARMLCSSNDTASGSALALHSRHAQ
jgi:hypothetical protein